MFTACISFRVFVFAGALFCFVGVRLPVVNAVLFVDFDVAVASVAALLA